MTIVRRERADGTPTFLVRPHVDGRRLKAKTFVDEDAARDYDNLMRARGKRGVFSSESCDSYARRWTTTHAVVKSGPTRGKPKKLSTVTTYKADLRPFEEWFCGVPLADVSRGEARRFAAQHPRSVMVARNLFADAIEDELVRANPFGGMRLEQSRGRKDHDPLREHEVHDLAEIATRVHSGPFGAMFAGFVLFTFYEGHRLSEGLTQEWRDIDPHAGEVFVRQAKFDKPRTIALFPQAWEAIRDIASRPADGRLVLGRRGRAYSKSGHYFAWNPVRQVFWAGLSESRRNEIVDLDWHSLRHACGHHLYVTLGLTAELTAVQLGHEGPRMVESLYGHFRSGALERLKAEVRACGNGAPQAIGRTA